MRLPGPCLTLVVALWLPGCADPAPGQPEFDHDPVVAEIEASLRAEIASFESKDCDAVVAFYEDREPLFVVGGRTMPGRADLSAACPGITARIPDGATRPVASEHIYALSPRSGYSVTEFRIPSGPGGPPTSQFVTKVWSKAGGSWRIVHVHESVAPAGSSPGGTRGS